MLSGTCGSVYLTTEKPFEEIHLYHSKDNTSFMYRMKSSAPPPPPELRGGAQSSGVVPICKRIWSHLDMDYTSFKNERLVRETNKMKLTYPT